MSAELEGQLRITIKSLERKQVESPEDIICTYIVKYKYVLECLEESSDNTIISKSLRTLKNLARSYLEISSNYDQVFLTEMGKTESLI